MKFWFLLPLAALTACGGSDDAAGGGGGGGGGGATSYTLTVSSAPVAGGGIVSSPAGINCGNGMNTCTASFSSGALVTLSVTAASGYQFNTWSSDGSSCAGNNTCQITMSANRTVGASFATTTASANLCQGLVTDQLAHPLSAAAVARPARLGSYVDPRFGTTIRRVTDVRAQFDGNVAKPAYSTVPAWNADETYLILYITDTGNGTASAGHYLFDGKTYQFIRQLNIDPADIEHFYWSSTDPDILYYPSRGSGSLIRYHVGSQIKDTLTSFPNDAGTPDFGGDPIYGSWDNDLFGLAGNSVAFTWRASTGMEGTRRTTSNSNFAPQIAPSGTLYMLHNNAGGATTLYNAASEAVVRTMSADTFDHGTMMQLANGQDVWSSVQFDPNLGTVRGTIVAENLTTGVVSTIVGEANGWGYPPSGTHLSGLAFQRPGWVAASVIGDGTGQRVLEGEIILANVNDGTVCRVGHHRSEGGDYWDEPHVNISPRGTRLLYASDWNDGATVDTYVIELPSYVP